MTVENKRELLDKILELKKKLVSLRFKKASGDLVNVSEVKKVKKEVARLFTKINMQA